MGASHAGHSGDHGDGHGEMGHVSTPQQLLAVFAALIVLTFITVWISRGPYDFGWISLPVALFVATIKAGLVMAFFMHLRHDRPFNILAFCSGYLFLALFLWFVLLDSSQYQQEIRDYKAANPTDAMKSAAEKVIVPPPFPPAGSAAPTAPAAGPSAPPASTSVAPLSAEPTGTSKGKGAETPPKK
ncbi:MAG TPA: cytochrome C oxidase subunit IV family protein [Planctomycetia bacterium]|nr:cytochrome C oxidase subunit IV family protein [Planctomycetia bacterium]